MFSQLFAIKCLGHFPLNDSGKSSASVPSRLPHHQARSWRSLTWRMGRVRTYESTLKLLGVRESMFNNGTRFFEYCLLCTAGRGTLDVEDVEDVEDVADVEDVKDVEDRTWRT